MVKNKRYACKFASFGCGGSCFGKARIEKHEASCRFAPADGVLGNVIAAEMERLSLAIEELTRQNRNTVNRNRRLTTRVHTLEQTVKRLENVVKTLVPSYDNIKLSFFHLPRYIMEKSQSRVWAEGIVSRCKYGNPKHLGAALLQHLMETEPHFFKLKSYDTVTVACCLGKAKLDGVDITLKEFVTQFYACIFVLMRVLWPDREEVNKTPFLPRIMCCGFSEDAVNRLDRQNKFVQSQHARQNKLELHQRWVEQIDNGVELFRSSFRERVAS